MRTMILALIASAGISVSAQVKTGIEILKENGFEQPRVTGTDKIRTRFSKRFMVEDIIDIWNKDTDTFVEKARQYFLY